MSNDRIDFVGIGVQKAGTSWLYKFLSVHPEIQSAIDDNSKELNFFNFNYLKGYHWYHARFQSLGEKVTGEFSPNYFVDENISKRIYKYNPDIKIIVSFRDPVARAISQHKHELRRNRLPKHLYDFDKALESNPTYIEQGLYATKLKNYLNIFEQKNIHVVLFEDIKSKPTEVLHDLYDFIGVDSDYIPENINQRVNVSHTYRDHDFYQLTRRISSSIRHLLGNRFHQYIKNIKISEAILESNQISSEEILPPVSEITIARLKKIFLPEIEALENIIGRDLVEWKN